MRKNYILFVCTVAAFISCSKKDIIKTEKENQSILSKSVKSVKKSAGALKNYVIEPDSIKQERKNKYFKQMQSKNSEYISVEKFFSTPSPFLLEKKGDFYKVYTQKIFDGKSIVYRQKNDKNEVLYLYVTDKNFFLYTFNINKGNLVEFAELRRIKKGNFSQPMHDLIFENNQLKNEDFVSEVNAEFFTKGKKDYFEYKQKLEGEKVKSLFDLGQTRNF